MLDLVFRNNQAPALNADNMNKIVNGINQNEAKSKDLQSEIATLVIEKGGSIVQANPEEIPTEKITSIRINEDVFEMASETGIEVTQAEYDALKEAGQLERDVNYYITDGESGGDSTKADKKDLNTLKHGSSGGVNLIPFPYYENSGLINGITVKINKDGSITLNGKPTRTTFLQLVGKANGEAPSDWVLKEGNYAVINNHYDESFIIRIGTSEGSKPYDTFTKNGILTVTTPRDTYILIRIDANHEAFDNLTIKPMLVEVNADGSYPTEYERWIPSVQGLDEKKADNTVLTDVFDATKSYSAGDYFISNNQMYKVKVACSGVTPPNSTYYDAISVMTELKSSLNDLDFELVYNYSALKIYKNKNQVKLVSTGWHNTGSVILPEDVRPKNNVYVACVGTGTDWSNKSSGFLVIYSSGRLEYTAYNTGLYNTVIDPANVIGFNASYFI